jgi:membrane fusion protein (multidrug efflux system)
MTPRRPGLAPLVLVVAGLAACKRADAPKGGKAPEPHVKVDTEIVAERPLPKDLTLTGVLDADQRTDLAANATGRVVRTLVERGQRVSAGDLLVQLDTRAAALSRVQAVANAKSGAEQLASVRADCERYEGLLQKGAITQQEYEKTTAQCRTQAASQEGAQAHAAEATQMIGDASIRAPFAGVIAERFAHVGDFVRPDSRVVTLLVDEPLRLRLTVPEPAIGFAKEGVPVTFETVAAANRSFSATIKYVGRELRPATRDLVVEAIVDNTGGALLPGMFVTAHLPTGEAPRAVVPRRALVPLDASTTVFVVVEGRLQQRVVQVGAERGDVVPVIEGVKKGERIVVSPSAATVDGALVD